MKKNSRSRREIRVPVSWRILSVLSMLPLGAAIFYIIFSKSGGKYPLAAGESTDPYFFGFIFAVSLPAVIYIFIIDKVLRGIVSRRAGTDIAKDIAVDVATAAAITVVDAVLGGGGSSTSSSSSGGGMKGGGGESGGGGASGSY